MAVEFVSPAFVHSLVRRVAEARTLALQGFERMPEPGSPRECAYWEAVLEANAAHVLSVLTHTRLREGFRICYRFYGNEGGDLRVRPFAARSGTDVAVFRRVLDWHPPPDARGHAGTVWKTRDVDLLYRHFTFPRTAEGVFEYWFAVEEIWASTYWAHARVLATPEDVAHFLSRPGWHAEQSVEHCAPAVVLDPDQGSLLAVLVYSPLGREIVTLEQVAILPDQSVRYIESVPVGVGPKGYMV